MEIAPGVWMPRVGFGTAGMGDYTREAVLTALQTGYRSLDTAQVCRPFGLVLGTFLVTVEECCAARHGGSAAGSGVAGGWVTVRGSVCEGLEALGGTGLCMELWGSSCGKSVLG